MGKQRILQGLALLIGGWMIYSPAPAQEYRGSAQQQMACTPDVWRLCSDRIPDVNRIVACLRQNAPQLSPRCRAVFDAGSGSPHAGPNRGMARTQPYAAPPPPYAMRPPPPYYDEDDDY